MKPGIDPKIDYAFKKIFGSEANRDILIALLNAILRFPVGQRIVAVELINPFNEKDTFDGKLSIVDVKARDESGRLFIVEMQMVLTRGFKKRVLYYLSKLFVQQLSEGEQFEELKPTYCIAILNDVLFEKAPAYHTRFQWWDKENEVHFSDVMEVHIIELPKFKLEAEQIREPLESWCYFLRHADELDDQKLPTALNDPPIHKAMGVLKMISETERERFRQIEREMAIRDKRNFDLFLEEERAKALARGEARGGAVERIRLCLRILKQPSTAKDELLKMPLADLERLAAELEGQLPVN